MIFNARKKLQHISFTRYTLYFNLWMSNLNDLLSQVVWMAEDMWPWEFWFQEKRDNIFLAIMSLYLECLGSKQVRLFFSRLIYFWILMHNFFCLSLFSKVFFYKVQNIVTHYHALPFLVVLLTASPCLGVTQTPTIISID